MTQENLVLVVQRKIKASPERLFDAWTKPELMRQWFRAREKMTTPVAEADLKVGGPWKVVMRTDEGKEFPNNGKYLELDRPNKLVFTWHPMGMADYETKVTLRFKKISDGFTEMTLTHEGLRDQDWYNKHQGGWIGCVDSLESWMKDQAV
ncbi:MAG TPA: SRPBCC domain-containing protein [bacterium]|nr:SRPBCC domain-containing protein [bacterium]